MESTSGDTSSEEGAHPFIKQMKTEDKGKAEEQSEKITMWHRRWVRWNLAMAGVSDEDRERYMPQDKLRWKKVPIQDNRSGPVPSVKCPPTLAAAVRAAETFKEIATNALERPKSRRWRKAFVQLIESKHCSIEALEATIGQEAFTNLMEEAAKLLQWMVGRSAQPPNLIVNQIEAARRKSIKIQESRREEK